MQRFAFISLIIFSFANFTIAEEIAVKESLVEAPITIEKSHAVSIFGDVKYPANFKHFEYVNPAAPKGGEIVLPQIGTFNNLNPFILKGQSAAGNNLIFDTLMSTSLDETGTNYGLVAKSVELASDNSYIIFNIDPRARFSDGSEVTAEDVVFSFNILLSKGHPAYQIYFGEIGEASVLSKYRAKFTFKNTENRELKFILGSLPILSKAYYDNVDFEKTTLTPPLGSGPYAITSIEQGRSMVFVRRDDYWAKDLPANIGFYNFDKIRYEYYKDSDVAIQALKSNKLDLRYENVAKNWANAYNIKAVEQGRLLKEKIPHSIPTGMQAFVFNTRKDKFADKNVRKAVALAFDFEWMNKNLFYGSYSRTTSYFSNSIYASSGLPQGAELELLEELRGDIPDEVFAQPFTLPESDGSGRIRNQLVEAAKLLEQAGWEIQGEQLYKDGKPFEIEFLLSNGGTTERLIPSIAKNLQQLGITTKIRSVDSSQYKKRTENFDFDIIINVWGQGNSPGNEQMNYWHSSTADVTGSRNYIGIKDPAIDSLVQKIVNAQNKDELVAATRALDRVLLWNYYVIPQFYAGYFRIVHWDKFKKPDTLAIYDSNFGLWTWWATAAENSGEKK